MVTRKVTSSKRAHALKNGYRSGLEEDVCKQLEAMGVPYEYEKMKIKYIKPASEHQYTPDIVLDNGIIVEAKGYFESKDRTKMVAVKKQNPHLDIRFLFQKANNRITKSSNSRMYWQWCEDNGFLWAEGTTIPKEWFDESK